MDVTEQTEVYTCLFCATTEPFVFESTVCMEPGEFEGYFKSRVTCCGCTASGPWSDFKKSLTLAKQSAVSRWNSWMWQAANRTIKALEDYRDC